jgi:hypothetical protein
MGVLTDDRTQHRYQACRDEDCQRFACRVWKEGYRAGYGAGHAAGRAEGTSRLSGASVAAARAAQAIPSAQRQVPQWRVVSVDKVPGPRPRVIEPTRVIPPEPR